jgi:hypothetical protein
MQVHRSASWSVDPQKAVIYTCIKKDRFVLHVELYGSSSEGLLPAHIE